MWCQQYERVFKLYNLIMILPDSVGSLFSQETSLCYTKKSIEFLLYVWKTEVQTRITGYSWYLVKLLVEWR